MTDRGTTIHEGAIPEGASPGGTTRRAVLAGLAGTTVIAALPAVPAAATVSATATPAMPESFLAASSKLCGIALDKSYLQLAGSIWQALAAQDGRTLTEICRIAAAAPDDATLRRRLVDDARFWPKTEALISAWYTGMVPTGTTPGTGCTEPQTVNRVITFDEALAWTVCEDFTKPPATCGGPFGYWHDEPPA
ncbi:sorbitol dehydrogenase family protein [Azospirillum canadense]|uniref:sorbitol dehydrogenase family protein n=1 Tax=Azospirillum canadense TaxID=403962 RepID=UPI0022260A29|nr:sorbitol dehydrogenase family protein [Azospirillum canadense]MCW2239777.1 hypothetical protein [Azospirillum canadense]